MPPIPITFHTRPTPRRFSGGTNAAKQPLYFSVDSKSKSKATSTHSIPPTPKSAPKTTIAPAQATSSSASGSGSGSSSTSTTPAPSARRKSTIPRPTSTKGYITLTPLNSAILDRCLLANPPSNPTPTISPRKHSSKTPIATPAPSHILPYSRMADLANDRSPNPSPREILRAQRAEAEKARNKKDSVAAARAAIAAKKKPKKGGRGKGSNSAPRSPSPSNEVRGLLGLGGSGLRQEVLPTITTEMASPEYTAPTVPLPTSRSLKRTRSAGIPPLSTGVANALGTGNLGIGSPLKAVIGPDGDDGDDAEEAGKHRMKRSRTHEPILPSVKGGPGPSGLGTNRKKSHSPKGTKAAMVEEALPVPKTVPMAAGRLVPGASGVTRQSGRASSVAVGAGLGGLVGSAGVGGGEGMGGTSMRRAVSAAGAGSGGEANRRDSMGSQGSEGMVVSGRSRREVNLPRALRDYETRPGTMV